MMPISSPAQDPEIDQKPLRAGSSARWITLTLLFTITVINFIDRQTVSILAPLLRQMLHLSNEQYGRIVASFQFGMMTGEFPMGWLMDRWGVRFGLAGAVLWWSIATGTQSFCRSGMQLGATRFWMGTGESGNYSGGIKTIFRIFSPAERTLAIGIFNSGSMIGATIAPPLIVYLAHRYGYRAAFLVPALFGILWVPLWFLNDRDFRPVQSPGCPNHLAAGSSATVFCVGGDVVPFLRGSGHAILLVLDPQLSLQRASPFVASGWLSRLDSFPAWRHGRGGGRLDSRLPATQRILDLLGAQNHHVLQRRILPHESRRSLPCE